MRFALFVSLILSVETSAAISPPGQAIAPCKADAEWTQPASPLHVHGDTWYVGTCGLSAILITSKQGHILIDGGVEENAPQIEANVRKLGFRVEDIRYIVNSHEHSDHAGGIAQLKRDSGANVRARAPAAAAFERGRGDRGDPQFLSAKAFPIVADVRRISDGDKVRLGALELTVHATPGHTPGSTSWSWRSCEKRRCLDIVYADSLTAISDDVFLYSDEAAHPGYLASFRQSLATIASLPCAILVTPHPDASNLWDRLGPQAHAPLIDTDACRRYSARAAENLDKRIAKEKAGNPS